MSEVLVWARRWAKRPNAAEHELLEVTNAATLAVVRAAYHRLARFAHPDLHRATVPAAELEEITEAFARVSNAYSMLMARLRKESAPARTAAAAIASPPQDGSSAASPAMQGASKAASAGAGKVAVSTTGPATGLSSKAMLHYRRAELCLRRGELIEAKLHLRLALASDPQSTFLRAALDELERQ